MKPNIFDWREFEPSSTCHIAVAIIGAGAIGAGASIYSANQAANAQTSAANAGIAAQQQMFNQAQTAVQPFISAGSSAIPQLQSWLDTSSGSTSPLASLVNLTTPGADMTSTLEQTPGYQFSLTQGEKATSNALAARGLAGPGGALAKGSANYAEGLAGTTWQSVVNALQNTVTSGANSLQNLVNTGAGSAQSLAGNAVQTGQGISSNLIGAGNAQAGAATATGNAIGSAASSVPSALLLQQLASGSANSQNAGLYGGNYTGMTTSQLDPGIAQSWGLAP